MPRLRHSWAVVPLVLLFFWLALNSLVGDSPTMDEQNHLARGLAFLRTGDPRLSLEHPPLINSLSALPLLTLPDIRLPLDDPSWGWQDGWYRFADLLLWQYNHDVTRMIFLARLPIVFLTLGLALSLYHSTRSLWRSRRAGLVALGLCLFDPNILAHGHYTTTDLGGAVGLWLATWLLWRLWQETGWNWRRWWAAGIGLGVALGSKLTALAFGPVWLALALLPQDGQRWEGRRIGRNLAQLVTAGTLALMVVWLIFGLQWGPLRFESPALERLNAYAGPMPTFWAGVERILFLSQGGRPTFLAGQFSDQGFWQYFPVAFLVKTPLPTLALLLTAAILLLRGAHTRRRAVFCLLPAALYFGLSMQSGLNIGYRHLLPILPPIFCLIGGLWAQHWGRRARLAGIILLAAIGLTTLRIHPYYLSYFNALGGGPANGYNLLIDSNIDWGQDLLRLQEWMAQHEVVRVKLAWFGSADPAYYDLTYDPLPGLPRHFDLWWNPPFNTTQPEPGIYAISVSNLWELPLADKTVFAWFRARPPTDRVGYSILIYVVE